MIQYHHSLYLFTQSALCGQVQQLRVTRHIAKGQQRESGYQ